MTGKRPHGDGSPGFLEGLELVSERPGGMLQALCWPLPLCLASVSSRPWLPSLPEGALLQETVPIYFIFEQLWASFASMYVDQFLKNTSWVPAWIRVGWRPQRTSRA